jgi:hypothetical protein
MRSLNWLPLLLWLAAGCLMAGEIKFQTTPLGGNLYQFDYTLTGFTFQANQELDFRFDPSVYGNLSNPVAPAIFQTGIFQTNNPPGASGDYWIYTTTDNPSTVGQFSVDAIYNGPGMPSSQQYVLYQFNDGGNLTGTIASGAANPAIPEPASVGLTGLALVTGAYWFRRRPLSKKTGARRPGVIRFIA